MKKDIASRMPTVGAITGAIAAILAMFFVIYILVGIPSGWSGTEPFSFPLCLFFWGIPALLGAIIGGVVGILTTYVFRKVNINDPTTQRKLTSISTILVITILVSVFSFSHSRDLEKRNAEYETVMNWDHQQSMQEFDLSRRDMSTLYLPSADLRNANLDHANLSFAGLTAANLSGANLTQAYLWSADLSGADLSGADLSGTDLSGTNLSQVRYTSNTVWPDNFDPEAAGAILVDNAGNPIEISE